MVRTTGRALNHASKAIHRLLIFATGFLVVASCLLVGASWRLSQGPIDLGWFADPIRLALINDVAAGRVSFDGLVLAWEGFHRGVDHPIDLRISNFVVTDPTGRRLLAAPDAHLTLSLAGLILGRIVPRTLEVDRGEFAMTREISGSVTLGFGHDGDSSPDPELLDLRQLRDEFVHPASSDHGASQSRWDQIQRAHFRDTAVTFRDRGSGLVILASGMDLDLVRVKNGRVHGSVNGLLSLSGEQTSVAAVADLTPSAGTSMSVRLTSLRPAAIAGLPASLAFLTDLDVPVSITAAVELDGGFKPGQLRVAVHFDEGRIRIGRGALPLRNGVIAVTGTTEEIVIEQGRFELAHHSEGAPEILDLTGRISHASNRLAASLTVGLNRIDLADLPRLWPVGVGAGARPWVIEHVIGGMVTNGTASLVMEADDSLNHARIVKAAADLNASNATFTWLDDTPPIEQAEVHLHLVDTNVLDIHLTSGRQRVGNHDADLAIKDSEMRITGLSLPDQTAKIHAQVDGRLASALALLAEPRLHLLSAHPIGLNPAAGDVSVGLDLQFPLENKLRIDDIQIRAMARLSHVKVADVAAGQELDEGTFDLDVDKDGLRLKGRGALAKVPVTLDGTMDFNPGAADQIIQKIALTGQPEAAQLDAAGLHVMDVVNGPIPMTAVIIERRNGDGSISIGGDLTQATLELGPLAWRKPPGSVVNATVTLLMSRDRLTKIDRIAVQGNEVTMNGSANLVDGHVRSVLLDNFRLGRTQGHGTIHISANNEFDVVLQGSQIDLSMKLTEKSAGADAPNVAPSTKPPWRLDARFTRAILANGESASDILAKATGAGETIVTLDVIGAIGTGADFSIKIGSKAANRRLSVEAKDAGRFLRGIDAVRTMESGHLTLDSVIDNSVGFYPLAGTAMIDGVVVRNSPALGKLLQAITLYGLVDALRGPGMTFSHIVVPFRYDGANLNLDDAHAANSSLGLTAKGRISLPSGKAALTGTIVPAYFFNSALGRLPLVGKLFSPEKGGGVFATRFGLEGSIEDPIISINPISALTPGFLRDIFEIFDKSGTRLPASAPKSR